MVLRRRNPARLRLSQGASLKSNREERGEDFRGGRIGPNCKCECANLDASIDDIALLGEYREF